MIPSRRRALIITKVYGFFSGIILYILLCGYPPFVSPTGEQEDLFDLILIGDYEFPAEHWDHISEDGKDLIMRMIESDVDLRLEAEEVLEHPWLVRAHSHYYLIIQILS